MRWIACWGFIRRRHRYLSNLIWQSSRFGSSALPWLHMAVKSFALLLLSMYRPRDLVSQVWSHLKPPHKVSRVRSLPVEASQLHESHLYSWTRPLTVMPKNTLACQAALDRNKTRIMAMPRETLFRTGSSYCRGGTYIIQTLSKGQSCGD